MRERAKPKLWSDFDGTAVGLVPKTNWRNWSKYPLPGIEGYIDFLRGVQNGGVEIAGIVSRRPNIAPRRIATARSIIRLGMDQYFPGRHQVVLAGSEYAKAEVVAKASQEGQVGMIDDKPHKFVPALAASLGGITVFGSKMEIVVGAVNHGRRDEYLERLADQVTKDRSLRIHDTETGFYIEHASSRGDQWDKYGIQVVPVEPFSEAAGQAFAATLTT
jgi:hypothetical protein